MTRLSVSYEYKVYYQSQEWMADGHPAGEWVLVGVYTDLFAALTEVRYHMEEGKYIWRIESDFG